MSKVSTKGWMRICLGRLGLIATGLSCLAMIAPATAQPASGTPSGEAVTFDRVHRGAPIKVGGTLLLPSESGKVPVMIVHHGSGGVSDAREFRYASELVALGVGAFVINSFKPRGITSTVSNQQAVTANEMTQDAFAALATLSKHPRVDPRRIGIVGFSKGASVALMTALARNAARYLSSGPRFALHVALYPGCGAHPLQPKGSGAPILMLLGGADTYVGVAPCTEYAAKLQAAGNSVEVKIYPGAGHGFDGQQAFNVPTGENWSRCIFDEQPDGSWKERISGQTTMSRDGKVFEAAQSAALAACRVKGVSGGPNAAAKAQAMTDVKAAVSRHLLNVK